MPTNKDIEQAKTYIRRRLEAEGSMSFNLEKYMKEAARRIADIAWRYRVPPSLFRFSADRNLEAEVDEVIRWLKAKIEEAAFILATAYGDEEDKDIIAHICAENHGKTFVQRADIYCRRFKYELEGVLAAGLLLGAAKDKVVQSVNAYLRMPYANPMFREAAKMDTSATRLLAGGASYGPGRAVAMFNALDNLTGHAVSGGWMKHWADMHEGASGFYSYRGSSYPCTTCDTMVGRHPLSDYRGGWHLRCKCIFVFI